MLKAAPGLNVLNASARAKIAKEIEIIKENLKKSSKIVDENGEPLVVYHGTRLEELYFKDGLPYTKWIPRFNVFKSGFFTSSYDAALTFANGNESKMYACFLDIKNQDMCGGRFGQQGVGQGTS